MKSPQIQELKRWFRREVLDTPAYRVHNPKTQAKLNQNELPWDRLANCSNPIDMESMQMNRYPGQDAPSLRQCIAQVESRKTKEILIANGSNVLIQALVLATAVGGKVMTVRPGFSLYDLEARMFAKTLVQFPLSREDFSLSSEAFLKQMLAEKPHLIIIANPNAPTGNAFEIHSLLEIVKQAPCIVAIDEAYFPFSSKTMQKHIDKHPNLVIIRTLSKAWGLAGLRVGYLMGHEEVLQEIEKVLLPYRISKIVEEMALLGLKSTSEDTAHIEQIQSERSRLISGLNEISGVRPFPSETNYILFRVDKNVSFDEVLRGLETSGVLIRNVSDDDLLKNCARVTVGTPDENDLFLRSIKKVMNGKS